MRLFIAVLFFATSGWSSASKLHCVVDAVNESQQSQRMMAEAYAETAKRRFREIYGTREPVPEGGDLADDLGGISLSDLTPLQRERMARVAAAAERMIDDMIARGASPEEIAAAFPIFLPEKLSSPGTGLVARWRREASSPGAEQAQTRSDRLEAEIATTARSWREGLRGGSAPSVTERVPLRPILQPTPGTSSFVPVFRDVSAEDYQRVFGPPPREDPTRIVLRAVDDGLRVDDTPIFQTQNAVEAIRQLKESQIAEAMGLAGVPRSRLVRIDGMLYVATEFVGGQSSREFFQSFRQGGLESGTPGVRVREDSFHEQVAFRFLMRDPDGHPDNFNVVRTEGAAEAELVGFDTGVPHHTHPGERGSIGTFLPDRYPARILSFLGEDTPSGEIDFRERLRGLFRQQGLPVIEGELQDWVVQRRLMLTDHRLRFGQ